MKRTTLLLSVLAVLSAVAPAVGDNASYSLGVPHASFIYENRLTLADYLEYLKDYNFNRRLTVETADGAKYEIYFVKVSGEETAVNVPKDSDYTVWSNNVDGYVVTVKIA